MALARQTVTVPFVEGLAQREDGQAVLRPKLLRADNAVFDRVGSIRKRRPYSAYSTGVVGGGSLGNLRRLATFRDELLAFSKDTLYSYSAHDDAWIGKGRYMAPALAETESFTRTSEQIQCERAQLGSVVWMAWYEDGDQVYLAARDVVTGAILQPPTAQGAVITARPRLIALTSVVLLFAVDDSANDLYGKVLDPADVPGSVTATLTQLAGDVAYFDVTALTATTAIVAIRQSSPTTSYAIRVFDEAAAETSSSVVEQACDGPIAVAVAASGNVAVMRFDGSDLRGDILTSALATVSMDNAVGAGTTPAQVTAAFRSVQNAGQYRCYAFWSASETSDTGTTAFITAWAWIDDAGTTSGQSTLARRLGVASHAADYEGNLYVWTVFAGSSTVAMGGVKGAAVQNTYFLYGVFDGDTAELIGQSAPLVAGGFSHATGQLPSLQVLGTGLHAALVRRRQIPLGDGGTEYAARTPLEVAVTLDSDDARRTVEIGKALYLSGALPLLYDGDSLVEVGFPLAPWDYDAVTLGGSLSAGTRTYYSTWRWDSAQGEIDRSGTLSALDVVFSASQKADLAIVPLHTTRKLGDRSALAVEVWRTQADPSLDAPAYLVTSKDPTATGDNEYIANDPDALGLPTFTDGMVDATAAKKEALPDNGESLTRFSPPPSTIWAASDTRIFVAGIAGREHEVQYSRYRGESEIASFNGLLAVQVPRRGGSITALAVVNDLLIVFRETAIYAFPGPGYDNNGNGANYGPAQVLSQEVGALSADVLAVVSEGVLFQSRKGWHLVDRGLGVTYVGAPVCDHDGDTWVACHALDDDHKVICVSTARMLCFDTVARQWSTWTISDAQHAVVHDNAHHYCTSTTVYAQDAAHGGATNYSLDIELAILKEAGLVGWKRVRRIAVLGEYVTAHDLRVRLARDYQESYFQDKTWTVSPTTAGDGEIVRHSPSQQRLAALKIRLTDQAVGSATPPAGEGVRLHGLSIDLGIKPGLARLAAARSQ